MVAFIGQAQNYNELSNIEKQKVRLKSHLLIDLDKVSNNTIDSAINYGAPIAIYPSINEGINSYFIKHYKKKNNQLIVITKKNELDHFDKEIKVIKIDPKEIEQIELRSSILKDSVFPRFKADKDLRLIKVQDKTLLNDTIFLKLWEQSGKLPNFIYSDSTSLRTVSNCIALLNNSKVVYGIVKTENGFLNHVTFKNFRNRLANGYFCFPIDSLGTLPVLIPHKSGYYFSPDIIYTSVENQSNSKDFIGYSLEHDFELTYHFVFDKIISNKVNKIKSSFIFNNVIIKKDSLKGNVGYFNNRAYIDIGPKSRSSLKSSFTITAWIKPTETDYANSSILGKGHNFVLKIHEGKLTYTMAGIKDYISQTSPIPIKKWTHVALVHSKIDNELIFYINGKETDRVPLIKDYVSSNHNLLIGSNLWEEYFVGYISEVKIWERDLNNTEIKFQFNNLNKPYKNNNNAIIIGVVGLIFVLILLAFWMYRVQQLNKVKTYDKKKSYERSSSIKELSANYTEQILCFGPLKIINKQGVDLAKRLSPKLKKLFIIIYLQSQKGLYGISTKKLTESLWPGMSLQSAKNTRGTNIQNLRHILADCNEIELVFQDKFWFIHTTNQCYNEYQEANEYLDLFSNDKIETSQLVEELPNLLDILKQGRFLTNTSDAWLDPFIEKYSNQIVGFCFEMVERLSQLDKNSILYSISEVIYLYDDLNEQALQLKLKVLIKQGKLSLAHNVYDRFIKLYRKIYKEDYNTSFEEIVSKYNSD